MHLKVKKPCKSLWTAVLDKWQHLNAYVHKGQHNFLICHENDNVVYGLNSTKL